MTRVMPGAGTTTDATDAANALQTRAQAAVALTSPSEAIAPNRPTGEVLHKPEKRVIAKYDRYDPRAEQKAARSLQLKINSAQAELSAATAQFRLGNANDIEALGQNLQSIYRDISAETLAADNLPEIRDQAKFLKDRLVEIKTGFNTLDDSKTATKEKGQLNKEAIEFLQHRIKLQIREALFTLQQTNGSVLFHAQTTGRILADANENCDHLVRELNWRKNRVETSAKAVMIQTLNQMGQTVWGINMDALDISQKNGFTIINQRVWIKPHSRLNGISRDLKKEELDQAKEKLEELMGIYGRTTSREITSSFVEVTKQLNKLEALLKTDTTDTSSLFASAKDIIEAAQELIPREASFPIQKDISFTKDAQAGLRSRAHVLEGNHEDFITVSKTIAHLEDIQHLLQAAKNKGRGLSKNNHQMIQDDLTMIFEWAARGHVYPKQFAKDDLERTPAIIANGFNLQKTNKDEADKIYTQAISTLNSAANALRKRQSDIINISKGTERKLESIFVGLKDSDLQVRPQKIIELLKQCDFDNALAQIQDLKTRYFTYLSPEPGYIRVSASINAMEALIRNSVKLKDTSKNLDKLNKLAQLIDADINHKQEKRVIVTDVDAKTKQYVFVAPQTTLGGLAKQVRKDAGFLAIANDQERRGFQTTREWGREDLPDNSGVVYMITTTKPNTALKGLPFGEPELAPRASS